MKYSGRIIDIHTHVQPAEVAANRGRFLPGEPDFRLLYENPKYRLTGSADVLQAMAETGVDASVILGFAWRDPELLRRHNDMILADAAVSNGRLHGFTCVYPFAEKGTAGAEAMRCLQSGAAGIGEIGLYDRDLDREYIEAMAPVMKVCRELEKPLMMHVNEPVGHNYSGKAPMSIRGIYDFVREYPDNQIILAHWGGGLLFFNLLKKEAKQVLANVWFDSAASPFLYDPAIWKTAAAIIGAGRILLGTDFPLLNAERYISQLEESGLSMAELEMICFRNAEEVLGL